MEFEIRPGPPKQRIRREELTDKSFLAVRCNINALKAPEEMIGANIVVAWDTITRSRSPSTNRRASSTRNASASSYCCFNAFSGSKMSGSIPWMTSPLTMIRSGDRIVGSCCVPASVILHGIEKGIVPDGICWITVEIGDVQEAELHWSLTCQTAKAIRVHDELG